MDTAAFLAAYNASRNGCNHFVQHPLVRRFEYSDGVEEVADAGCHWLLDIIATECPVPLRKSTEVVGIVSVTVRPDAVALIELTIADGKPPIWKRAVDWTDMPPGRYVFELVDEGHRFAFALVSEH